MDNQKRENLLNLALDATEEERLKSVNLNVGYDPERKDLGAYSQVQRLTRIPS